MIKLDNSTKKVFGGLAVIVGSLLLSSVIKHGVVKTYQDINYGYNCASLNYGGNLPSR